MARRADQLPVSAGLPAARGDDVTRTRVAARTARARQGYTQVSTST